MGKTQLTRWFKSTQARRRYVNKLPILSLCIPNASPEKTEMRTAIRFCWQSAAIALAVITLAFVVPAIALCKVVPLASIASAIAVTTLIAGLGLYWAGRSIEKRSPRCERVDYYLQASILVVTAGLLWFQLIWQTGPWRDRNIDPTAGLAIVIVCGIAGALLLIRRGRRLASNGTN
jgi:hypothetical protein